MVETKQEVFDIVKLSQSGSLLEVSRQYGSKLDEICSTALLTAKLT